MRHTNRLRILALLLASLGCATPWVTIAPRPPDRFVEVAKVHSSGCGFLLLGHIPLRMRHRLDRAYADALNNSGGTSLIDTRITERWEFWIVGTRICTDLDGTAIRPSTAS